jgi:hypothetical protein
MFQSVIAFIWDRTPGFVKWPMVGGLILLWTPLKIREGAVNLIRQEVHAVVNPLKEQRDLEIKNLKEDISHIRSDVRAIGIHLMGETKLNRMTANDGEENRRDYVSREERY